MKHVIIAGSPRAGKTTMSKSLMSGNLGFTHYKMDSIKRAVFDIFCPENKDWHFASKVVARMIKKICDDNRQESTKPECFIFDTPHLYPEDLIDFPKDEFVIIFLGYTEISVEEKTNEILSHDRADCWTKKLERKKLEALVEGNIAFSKELKEQCEKYGIKYFEMSEDMEEHLFEAIDYVVQNI